MNRGGNSIAKAAILIFTSVLSFVARAQDESQTNEQLDSLYIVEVQDKYNTDKVLHAEPLYIDLIRDLGARKGEREWNFGMGITDSRTFDTYDALIEYEWAPLNRLGLEVELPFTFYAPLNGLERDSIPSDRLESLKVAAQWSFYVNERAATSMALGYIHEFELNDFRSWGNSTYKGNLFNPFLVVAKRWGNNFHTLVYTGPKIVKHRFEQARVQYEWHSNFHYMISGTRNFIGVEINKYFLHGDFDMAIRPQMRLGIADNFLIGIVGGIPIRREQQGISSFVRIIWEPKH